MSKNLKVFLLICLLQCTNNQHIMHYQSKPRPNLCDDTNTTAMVENFFNVAYAAFQGIPPACSCVQLCVGQPLYCHPDGCLNPAASRKKADHAKTQTFRVLKYQGQNVKGVSAMNAHTGLLNSLFDVAGAVARVESSEEKLDSTAFKHLDGIHRPEGSKENYNSIFKYKKTPKLRLRYNLRENMKNAKTDVLNIHNINLDKAQWPLTSRSFLFKSLDLPRTHNKETEVADTQTEAEKSSALSNGRYFIKRDIEKANVNEAKADTTELESDEIVEETEHLTQDYPYYLEHFIENLIESSFGPLQQETEIALNVNLEHVLGKNVATPSIKPSMFNNNLTKIKDEPTHAVFINLLNGKFDQNKYDEESKPKMCNVSVFKDTIGNLSKGIDKQNNKSMEVMELHLTKQYNDTKSNATLKDTTVSMTTEITTEVATNASIALQPMQG